MTSRAHLVFKTVVLPLSLGLTLWGPAEAQAEVDAEVEATLQAEEDESKPWLGLALDAGVPDGANLNLVYRPFHWLRFHAGPSYNLVGFGVRGGASLIPFDSWISPSLVVEGGHYFPSELSGFVEGVLGLSSEGVPERASYSYGNLHLGLELGTPHFSFFLRGGYSLIEGFVTPAAEASDGVRLDGDARVSALVPSAKLGFVVYVL